MLGIFGGSGFYSLLEGAEKIETETPYGKPSSPITVAKLGETKVAFIARHGESHEYPPHKIPYKANIHAFKELGVERIVAPTAVGSLKQEIKPGHFVVPDQFVSFCQRDDTFYNEKPVTHISSADPYCPELRRLLIEAAKQMNLPTHEKGTVVVIQGPRFASRAESAMFRSNGWEIINMTQYPEVVLARELEMCYANISLVTDYDTGLKGQFPPASLGEVVRVFNENNDKLKKLVFSLIKNLPKERNCNCMNALEGARF